MVDELEMVEPKPEKKRRKATLDDIKPLVLVVEIDDIDYDGEPVVIEFKLRELTYFQFDEVGKMVVDPSPVPMGADKQGRPILDTNSADFRTKQSDAYMERSILRLAQALIEPEIPGDTLKEKSAWIKNNIPSGIVQQLINAMGSTLMRGEARIKTRADSFQ